MLIHFAFVLTSFGAKRNVEVETTTKKWKKKKKGKERISAVFYSVGIREKKTHFPVHEFSIEK